MVPKYPSITRLFGLELEFFLIDKQGTIADRADLIIKELKGKLRDSSIVKECGKSMVELITFPHRSPREVFGTFFQDFESFLYELDVNDLKPFYYGTYPGKNSGTMRSDERYDAKAQILGKEVFPIANRCIGFHHHYTLPRSSFNHKIKYFYPDIKRVKQEKILNLYNLYTALDPAITTLMQSSPYYEGRLLGKDARAIVYRGEKLFKERMLYEKHPDFGMLENYAGNFKELEQRLRDKCKKWKGLLKEKDYSMNNFAKKNASPSLLDSQWNPVKISAHGTIESRGADMNNLSKVVAMSTLIKALSKYVQNEKINVLPDEIGNSEPFKLEKDTIFVPEFSQLSENLQYNAFTKGFENNDVLNYSHSLLKLIKKILPVEYRAPLRVFFKMVDDRSTTSDEIIAKVKKMQGSIDLIEEDTARKIATDAGKAIYKDLVITKKMCGFNLIFS